MKKLVALYPENYLAIYDLPLDTDLNELLHYPSVFIGKEDVLVEILVYLDNLFPTAYEERKN